MKIRRIIKDKSRIPGISVGEEVDTSVGEKKKVCFQINGRWFFRMVDPEWRAPGRPQKGRSQKTEVGGQKSEVRVRRSEVREQEGKGAAAKGSKEGNPAKSTEGDGE